MSAITQRRKNYKQVPGPPGGTLVGNLREFQKDPLGLFMASAQQYGDVSRFRFGPTDYYLLSHPDHIQKVLQINYKNYGKQTIGWKGLRLLLGNGLLTSEGDFWLRQRRIAQPIFHMQRIASFAQTMTQATQEMMEGWKPFVDTGKPLDISSEMMKLTLRIVGETLLSADVTKDSDEVGQALSIALRIFMDRITHPYLFLPLKIPTPQNRKLNTAINTLDRVVLSIIAKRRARSNGKTDLLDMLIKARDEETGESMNDQQLRDEVMTIFLAGHETTANALSWTWYLLSKHPEIRQKMEVEIGQVLAERTPSLEDIARLSYTKMVLQESLRLYPPVWMTTRSPKSQDSIGEYLIPKNTAVVLSPYVTHRHPAFWKNPEGFDPERFTPEKIKERPAFAYFPFGGGQRKCIGFEFALLEAHLVLAIVAKKYHLDLAPGHKVEIEPLITLRPKYGMKMTLHHRS